MKSFFTFISLFSTLFLCQGQSALNVEKRDSIIYAFPESVERLLVKRLKDLRKQNQGESESVYLVIHHKGYDTVYVGLSYKFANQTGDTSNCCNYYAHKTNRFAIIDTDFFPVVFWDDYRWGTTQPDQLGTLGTRGQIVLRCICVNDGLYGVTFTRQKVIGEDYGHARKIVLPDSLLNNDDAQKRQKKRH